MAALRYILQRTKRHRHEADLVAMGINDFLKGPEILLKKPNPFIMEHPPKSNFFNVIKMLISILIEFPDLYKEIDNFSLNGELWCGINNHV